VTFHYRAPAGRAKHDKEIRRAERKQLKAERLAIRREQKLAGVDVESLPEPWRGVARTLANGDTDGR
jgi:hypothetical protein